MTSSGTVTQARYQYDPYGRRISKTVKRNNQGDGWDGDRLVLTEKNGHKVHTLHEPGSFTPLLRVESEGGEDAYTPLVQKLQQYSQIPFTAQEYADMERLEEDLRTENLSERSRNWLEVANIPAHLMAAQLDPLPVVNIRRVHLYQCDHLGTPVALINKEGLTDWKAELDPWGNILSEDNPKKMEQMLRLPGQWYDEESGLHYNRHRYYAPQKGRYISQDPIGINGGINLYQYAPNPLRWIDPLGLAVDLNYYSPSDSIYKGSLNIKEFPNGFTVGGHGTPTSMDDDRIKKGSPLTIKQLSSDIKTNPKYHKGMAVVLFSCETGKGENSFAQQLANELNTPVIAPDEIIWIWPDGNYDIMGQTARITIGGKDHAAFEWVPDEKQLGDFHKFTPTGSK